MPHCPRCHATKVKKDGRRPAGRQRFRCRRCRRTFTARTYTPFAGHRWPPEVIVTAVRWYFCYRLSAADVRDLLAERHIDVSARTILSWAHKFGPLLAQAARRKARSTTGRRWWCNETYVRVGGRWAYLYRAIDEDGQVVDVLLRAQRDLASAEAFFVQATARRQKVPTEVITDKHQAYVRAVRERASGAMHVRTGLHRAGGQTTKAIERSHLPIKDRLRPMRGLHSIATGQRLLEGIEVVQAIRRGNLRVKARDGGPPTKKRCPYEAAREAVATFTWLASGLRDAA
jgi:transposase, IS6 family